MEKLTKNELMEKLTAFIKKNWLWIVIAVVVIIYLCTRKNKAESSYKFSPSGRGVARGKVGTSLSPTGWYIINSGHLVVAGEPGSAHYFRLSPGCVVSSKEKASPYYNWGYFAACGHVFSGGKAQGYYLRDGRFRVSKIVIPNGLTYNLEALAGMIGDTPTYLVTQNGSAPNITPIMGIAGS